MQDKHFQIRVQMEGSRNVLFQRKNGYIS